MTLQRLGVVELKGAGAWLLMLALALLLLSAPARAGWPGIQDWQIDWGTDALQVEAGDMPVTDGAWTYLDPATADVQATFDWLDTNWPGANYWQLDGDDLEPSVANRKVNIETTDAGSIGSFKRALRIDTDGNYHRGMTINTAGDNSDGLYAYTIGDIANAIEAYTTGTDSNGVDTIVSGSGSHAVQGYLDGTSLGENDTYGGDFTRMRTEMWTDYNEQAVLPADPPATYGRTWLSDGTPANTLDHHLYLTDEASYDHDLTVQMKDTICGQQLAQEATSGMTWSEGTGQGASMPAMAAATPVYIYNFGTDKMTSSHGSWSWNAVRDDGELIWMQSDIATGGQWDCLGSLVKVSVKYKISAAVEFDSAIFYLASNDGASGTTQAFSSIADGVWDIQEHVFDIGTSGLNWGISVTGNVGLHAGMRFDGKTLDNLDNYNTTLDIEWIMVEQWVD